MTTHYQIGALWSGLAHPYGHQSLTGGPHLNARDHYSSLLILLRFNQCLGAAQRGGVRSAEAEREAKQERDCTMRERARDDG